MKQRDILDAVRSNRPRGVEMVQSIGPTATHVAHPEGVPVVISQTARSSKLEEWADKIQAERDAQRLEAQRAVEAAQAEADKIALEAKSKRGRQGRARGAPADDPTD